MKEEIIKDYEKRIIDEINHLKNTASLLTRVTDETIDWSHHVSWDVKRDDKYGARLELLQKLKKDSEKLDKEILKFESLLS